MYICVCEEWGLTKGEGPGGRIPWWAGPDCVANDNLNLIVLIGGKSLEVV